MTKSPQHFSSPPRIGYQCVVDSFSKGDVDLEDKADLYRRRSYGKKAKLLSWDEECPEYSLGRYYYGGDLVGIERAIRSYLAELGVDLLYLTPIFLANSNHKYDTLDYHQIDPQFGDMNDFQKMLETAHGAGIRVILDGVFNHTSSEHPWFKKARKGIKPFVDYYQRNAENYFINWAGVETMPLLNYKNSTVRNVIYQGNDSVVNHWLAAGADGWRLDVAEGLGHEVLRDVRRAMQKHFPERHLIGEVVETYGRDWLGPDQLDGLVNYSFLGNTVKFLNGQIKGTEYLSELTKMAEEYPWAQLVQCWNIISTHDTNRMLYELNGNENLFKMAVALQFTYPGIPMIYYGDELGIIPGQKDVSNRQGMDWDRVDLLQLKEQRSKKTIKTMNWNLINQYTSFHYYYRFLVWLKKYNDVTNLGTFVPLYADETAIAFIRHLDDQVLLVIINRGLTRSITFRTPEFISVEELRGIHGPLHMLKISNHRVKMTVYGENTYLFLT